MPSKRYTYDLEIDADVRGLDDAEQAMQELVDAMEGTGDAARDALTILDAMASDMDDNLKATASAAEALREALGDAFTGDNARIEQMIQDLRAMGVEFDQIEANAAEFAGVIQRVDGIKLDAARAGLSDVSTGLKDVSDRGDQSRSVLANLAGNAAQDFGELGGAVGTLGVGLGQLVEYSVDGNIALSNLAKVAGPMAGLAAATFLVGKGMESIAEAKAFDSDRAERFTDAIQEGVDVWQALREEVAETGELLTAQDGPFGNSFFGNVKDILPVLQELGLTFADFQTLVTDPAATQALIDFRESLDPVEYAALRSNLLQVINAVNDYATSANEAALAQEALNDFLGEPASSLDDINAALRSNQEEVTRTSAIWQTLIDDMLDNGVIDTASGAWNRLRAELNLTDDAMAEMLQQKVDDYLQDAGDAAMSAAESFEAWQRSARGLEDFPVALAAVMKHIRNGTTDTEAFASALGVLERAFPDLSRAEIFDLVSEKIEEAKQKVSDFEKVEYDMAAAAEEAAAQLEALQSSVDDVGRSVDEVADRGTAMSNVLARFREMGELGQTEELIGFVDGMHGLAEAIDELSRKELDGLDLVPESWDEVLNMPEDLRPVVDALGSFAGEVQREMAQAFDTGGDEGVREWAENTRRAITESLLGAADLTDDQVNEILGALGLLPPQVDLMIAVANADRARGVIDSMASLIAGLPAETQLQIAAVADTDPIAALQLAIDALAAEGVQIPTELTLLLDELNGDIESYEPPPLQIKSRLDAEGVDGDLAGLQATADDNPIKVAAEADTETAVAQLDDAAEDRTSRFEIDLWNIIVQNALLNKVAEDRTAKITAEAHTANAGTALEDVAADRTAHIDAVLRSFPTESQIISRMTGGKGHIVIPVDTRLRFTARIDGARVPG